MEKASGRELVDKSSPYALGQFLHERFSQNEVNGFLHSYVRPTATWAWREFGKPGMPGPDKSPYAAITPSRWTLSVGGNEVADTVTLAAGDTTAWPRAIRWNSP